MSKRDAVTVGSLADSTQPTSALEIVVKRFWAFVFLTVPVFGVLTFVVAPYFNHLVPAGYFRARPRDRPVVHVHPVAHGHHLHRHRSRAVLLRVEVRRRSNPEPVKFSHGSHTLEVVWTILPAVTLLFIAIYQMNAWADAKMRRPNIPDHRRNHRPAVQLGRPLSRAPTASCTRRTTSSASTATSISRPAKKCC